MPLWICDHCDRESETVGCDCPGGLEKTRLEEEARAKFAAMTPAQRATVSGTSTAALHAALQNHYVPLIREQLNRSSVLLQQMNRQR